MFEVQINSKSDTPPSTIFESVHLNEAQIFYHQYHRVNPDINIRLIEVLRRS